MRLTNVDGTFDIVGLDEKGKAVTLIDCYPIALETGGQSCGIPVSAKGEFVITFKYEYPN